jgi:hypothetical protein
MALLLATSGEAAVIRVTSSAAFLGALSTPVIERFESVPVDTLIPSGSFFNGLQYFFPTSTSGRIDDAFSRVGASSLALERDGDIATDDFFFPGDVLTVTFPTPIRALGIFFNIGVSPAGSISITTPVGTALNGPDYDLSTLYFVGLISDTPFGSATFSSLSTISGWNVDELTWEAAGTAVPEPSVAVALLMGLGSIVAAVRQRMS